MAHSKKSMHVRTRGETQVIAHFYYRLLIFHPHFCRAFNQHDRFRTQRSFFVAWLMRCTGRHTSRLMRSQKRNKLVRSKLRWTFKAWVTALRHESRRLSLIKWAFAGVGRRVKRDHLLKKYFMVFCSTSRKHQMLSLGIQNGLARRRVRRSTVKGSLK